MGVLLYSQKEPENRGIGDPSLSVSPFQLVGCACAPFLCPSYVVRGAHPTLLIRFFTHHSSLNPPPAPGTAALDPSATAYRKCHRTQKPCARGHQRRSVHTVPAGRQTRCTRCPRPSERV